MSIIDILKEHCSDYGIEFNQDLAEKLEIYGRLLKEWNDKINLTAIKDDEGIAVKHFLDCLLVSKVTDFKNGMKVIDVGTGAGFPGLVIAAAYPDVNVTLLDSTGKKLKAVENMADFGDPAGVPGCSAVSGGYPEVQPRRQPDHRRYGGHRSGSGVWPGLENV